MSLSPMNRRGALKLLGLAAGASALAACAPSASKSETSGDPLAENGVKNFNFTAWSLNEASTKDALTGLVDTYAGASGGKITTASYPYNDYLNQLLLQVRGGSLTGVVQLDVAWLTTLAATGKLVDLAPLVSQGGYTDAAAGIGKAAGKQYGLPWTSAGIGLIG